MGRSGHRILVDPADKKRIPGWRSLGIAGRGDDGHAVNGAQGGEIRRDATHRRFVIDGHDGGVVAPFGEPDRAVGQAERGAQLGLAHLSELAAGRSSAERIAVAAHGEDSRTRRKTDQLASGEDVAGGDRRMTAQVDLVDWREPAQVEIARRRFRSAP